MHKIIIGFKTLETKLHKKVPFKHPHMKIMDFLLMLVIFFCTVSHSFKAQIRFGIPSWCQKQSYSFHSKERSASLVIKTCFRLVPSLVSSILV